MPISKIFFKRLSVEARIGILEHELRRTQPIQVDAEIHVSLPQQIDDHDIATVLDYRLIREAIIQECTRSHVHLVEVLGQAIAQRLLQDFASITKAIIRVSKSQAFSDCESVGIEYVEER